MTDKSAARRLYAVMGHPVRHSKSPVIHREFGKQCNVALEYRAIEVAPGEFERALRAFCTQGGNGVNITLPFKREAYALADRHSARAALAGAVNTLKFETAGASYGDNTDGVGLVHDLTANLGVTLAARRLLVLGAGGAVRGIIGPLLEQGPAALVIANRTVSKAHELAGLFAREGAVSGCGFDALHGSVFDVVINATAASLQGDALPLPDALFAPAAIAYDLMYADEPTAFMRWAHARGAMRVSDGLGMLVEQAAESFLVWHGVRPQTASMIERLRSGAIGD